MPKNEVLTPNNLDQSKEISKEVLPFETIKLSFEMWGMEEMRRMFIELNTRLNALDSAVRELEEDKLREEDLFNLRCTHERDP